MTYSTGSFASPASSLHYNERVTRSVLRGHASVLCALPVHAHAFLTSLRMRRIIHTRVPILVGNPLCTYLHVFAHFDNHPCGSEFTEKPHCRYK